MRLTERFLAPMGMDLGAQPRRPGLQQARCQPQPFQMPLDAGRDVVLIGAAAVQHMVVVDELHLARTQIHIDVVARVVGHGRDAVERLDRDGGEPRRIGMALRGLMYCGMKRTNNRSSCSVKTLRVYQGVLPGACSPRRSQGKSLVERRDQVPAARRADHCRSRPHWRRRTALPIWPGAGTSSQPDPSRRCDSRARPGPARCRAPRDRPAGGPDRSRRP